MQFFSFVHVTKNSIDVHITLKDSIKFQTLQFTHVKVQTMEDHYFLYKIFSNLKLISNKYYIGTLF